MQGRSEFWDGLFLPPFKSLWTSLPGIHPKTN